MKICILSDSHDLRENLREVMAQVDKHNVEAILHCGDVIAPSTLREIVKYDIPLHVIHGNNKGDLVVLAKMAADEKEHLKYYGRDADITLAGKRIFMVHYPHYAEAMALTGRYDLVCCGHSHKASIRDINNIKNGTTKVVDAGNTAGIGESPKYVIGDLDTMQFDIIDK